MRKHALQVSKNRAFGDRGRERKHAAEAFNLCLSLPNSGARRPLLAPTSPARGKRTRPRPRQEFSSRRVPAAIGPNSDYQLGLRSRRARQYSRQGVGQNEAGARGAERPVEEPRLLQEGWRAASPSARRTRVRRRQEPRCARTRAWRHRKTGTTRCGRSARLRAASGKSSATAAAVGRNLTMPFYEHMRRPWRCHRPPRAGAGAGPCNDDVHGESGERGTSQDAIKHVGTPSGMAPDHQYANDAPRRAEF
uniref:Uncharacterized protein n=1 Tax=Oryza meridionalis TaxID=40149 RepID=A0A0E0EY85_9ORYZ